TSILNAINFLFDREEIPPDILRYVMMYTLDSYSDKGEAFKNGTSQMAMMFLSNWLNQFARAKKLPILCQYLSGQRVSVSSNSEIVSALQQGGVAVVRLFYDVWHYVTLTGISGSGAEIFDPYYRKRPFKQPGIELITDKPFSANRTVSFEVLNNTGRSLYALGGLDGREAILLFNTDTRKTPERTIEYFL
ncbi:MAG: peptidase C39, partial [Oscillospiraceae bacterium]|nr:peptidase C39 [Oscillospiraceae bacterium]